MIEKIVKAVNVVNGLLNDEPSVNVETTNNNAPIINLTVEPIIVIDKNLVEERVKKTINSPSLNKEIMRIKRQLKDCSLKDDEYYNNLEILIHLVKKPDSSYKSHA